LLKQKDLPALAIKLPIGDYAGKPKAEENLGQQEK